MSKAVISGAAFASALFAMNAFPASADGNSCGVRVNNTSEKLLECVTLEAVRGHQAALQSIADGTVLQNRATGFEGYDLSVAYVVDQLDQAGYDVTIDEFPFVVFFPVSIEQLAPITATYPSGSFSGSGFGMVEGNVIPVDLSLADPASSSSGCEASDFAGLDFSGSNDIALVQRGTCFFSVKAANAEAAGAEAIIIFNQGTAGREGLIVANAANFPDGTPSNLTIPVVGGSFSDGVALSQPGSIARIDVIPPEETVEWNVIAESPWGDPTNVVMAGAHLDSVLEGPGIQDNGSGSAAILEVALQMAKVRPVNKVRFGWWGGEESGLVGSTAYVADLSEEEIDNIALYLNFDMIGSPNHVYFIYDGDDSDGVGAGPGPDGSAQIEALFETFYNERGIPFLGTDFSGRSDYGPFIARGIPSGGLFTGAEVIKTPEQAAIWGGTAGEQYDPCYHLACDTFDNINLEALDTNSDAVAYAVLQYAMNTGSINGRKGKGNFRMDKPMPFAGALENF